MKRIIYFIFAIQLLLAPLACLEAKTINIFQKKKAKPKPTEFINLNCYSVGMFSSFLSVLGVLQMYEDGLYKGIKVNFGSDGIYGLYYDPSLGPNWWEYYFEPIHLGNSKNANITNTVNGSQGCDYSILIEFHTPRKRASQLIKKYIKVKPHILQKVEHFVEDNFKGYTVIGVHYRGTDKIVEAPRIKYEEFLEYLKPFSDNFETLFETKIFVATDEQGFLEFMEETYPGRIISYNTLRSDSGIPLHFMHPNNYIKGEEALIDCLLLSKCQMLVKTSSNLSLCSAYFNPDIPMIHASTRPWRPPLE